MCVTPAGRRCERQRPKLRHENQQQASPAVTATRFGLTATLYCRLYTDQGK
jgi:hypothetical protein